MMTYFMGRTESLDLIMKEVGQPPDYDKALEALGKLAA